jgi:hypothetical protein
MNTNLAIKINKWPADMSERGMEAEEEEGWSHSSMDQVEAEKDLMREHEDLE